MTPREAPIKPASSQNLCGRDPKFYTRLRFPSSLTATNRDVHHLVVEGSFRRDLYWRLNVLGLFIPPLRERQGDIVPLMEHFLGVLSSPGSKAFALADDAVSFLMRYPWPGNVRELKNLCERLSVVHAGKSVDAAALSRLMEYCEPSGSPCIGPIGMNDIESAIAQAGGKLSRAAVILGIHRATLWRKRKRQSQSER